MMKKAVALMLALMLLAAACAFGEEEAETKELRRVRLGSSVYTVMIDEDFVAGELTEADIANGQIACFQNDETGQDFDVFQIAKGEGVAEELSHFTLRQADAEEAVDVVCPNDMINDIEVGWYWGKRTRDGEQRDVVIYIVDSGEFYVELVLWPANDMDVDVQDIAYSLDYMSLKEIRLGDSRFTLVVPDDYRMGQISEEDIADDQVAYWYSDASLMDFDVYQFSKEGCAPTLAEYVVEESSAYPVVSELVADAEINMTPVAWYRTVEECDEGEYDTITYIIDGGDQYIEVVFWLDGPTANDEADYIIHNLIDEALVEADDAEEPAA